MQDYELIVVLPGKVTSAKKKSAGEKIKKIVDINGGKITSSDDWGEISLGHKIKKQESGNFLLFKLELKPESVKAINDKLRMESDIVRYLLAKGTEEPASIKAATK